MRCPRLEKVTDGLFEGEEAVLHVIERIVAPLGLRVDESSPWVDARLSDGSRVQTRFLRASFSSTARFTLRQTSRAPARGLLCHEQIAVGVPSLKPGDSVSTSTGMA